MFVPFPGSPILLPPPPPLSGGTGVRIGLEPTLESRNLNRAYYFMTSAVQCHFDPLTLLTAAVNSSGLVLLVSTVTIACPFMRLRSTALTPLNSVKAFSILSGYKSHIFPPSMSVIFFSSAALAGIIAKNIPNTKATPICVGNDITSLLSLRSNSRHSASAWAIYHTPRRCGIIGH